MSRCATAYLYCLLLSIPFIAAASEPRSEKAAWELTLEERLAQRFDPADVKRRAELKAQEQRSAGAAVTGGDSIDGAREPELLMPWEVFQNLLMRGFSPIPESREVFREDIEQRAAGLNLDASFWPLLESVASEVLQAMHEQRSGPRGGVTTPRRTASDTKHARGELCPLRADALAMAREQFGAEWFDRFLYVAVAPGMGVSSSSELQDSPAVHRFIEGGCR